MDPRYLGLIGKVNWLVDEVVKLIRRVGFIENNQSGSSGLSIGDSVTGGGADRILYEDGSQNLASSADLTFDADGLHVATNAYVGTSMKLASAATVGSVGMGETEIIVFDTSATSVSLANNYNQNITLPSLGATTASGLSLQNPTAATTGHGGVLQSSPALEFLGSIQNGLGAVDGFRMYYLATGTGTLNIDNTSDGSTYTNVASIGATGIINSAGLITTDGISIGTSISVSNGNVVLAASGKTLDIETTTGASAAMGTATLVSGTKTVSTTAIATGNYIFLQLDTPGGTLGTHYSAPVGSIVNGTSFVINAVDTAGAVVTTDTSTIRWWIVKNH